MIEDHLTKKEMDKLRSSTLYSDEILYVICTANYGNFPKSVPMVAKPRMKCKSGLPYPQPKWIACDYYIEDTDGDCYRVARQRFGEIDKGFKWMTKGEQR